jgi:carboxyl-terminal processing protease
VTALKIAVIPDISFPPLYDQDKIGESVLDNALSWDRIEGANHRYYFDLKSDLNTLQSQHDKRIAKDPEFLFLQEQIAVIEEMRNTTHLSLNIEARRKEREDQKSLQLAMENRRRVAKGEEPLKVLEEDKQDEDGLQISEDDNSADAEQKDKKKMSDDPLLMEAGHILLDAVPYFLPERIARRP